METRTGPALKSPVRSFTWVLNRYCERAATLRTWQKQAYLFNTLVEWYLWQNLQRLFCCSSEILGFLVLQ